MADRVSVAKNNPRAISQQRARRRLPLIECVHNSRSPRVLARHSVRITRSTAADTCGSAQSGAGSYIVNGFAVPLCRSLRRLRR